jgi:hypothetical protein
VGGFRLRQLLFSTVRFLSSICAVIVTALFIPTGQPCLSIDIVFDRPPSPELPRFVEVENQNGRSINVGNWVQRPDGFLGVAANYCGHRRARGR